VQAVLHLPQGVEDVAQVQRYCGVVGVDQRHTKPAQQDARQVQGCTAQGVSGLM
jgi:hypothetical protein